jgi:hypothetical protein
MPRIALDGLAAMADPLDLMNEHATLIGSVVIACNKIHWVISVLFVAFSGMPARGSPRRIFRS